MDYLNPKLELKVNKQISELDLVKARAEMRTKRRIAEQIEKNQLEALELQVAKRNSDARNNIEVVAASPAIELQYTAKQASNGTTQYRKDGKLISKAEYDQAN